MENTDELTARIGQQTRKRPRYHQSEIATFLKCGLQWEFRYLRGIKIAPRSALTIGTSVDRSVTHNMTKKILKEEVSLDEVLSVASDEFEKEAVATEWDEDETKDQAKDQTIKLSRLHFEKVSPNIVPATVQQEFALELDGEYDVGGTMDLTDIHGFIRDTKTAARNGASRYVIERAFQPAIYSFAYRAITGRDAAGFVFDILKKPTKTIPVEYEERKGIVTSDDENWLFNSIDRVHSAIKSGVALPAPEGAWWCNKDWCGYWHMCKGKKS